MVGEINEWHKGAEDIWIASVRSQRAFRPSSSIHTSGIRTGTTSSIRTGTSSSTIFVPRLRVLQVRESKPTTHHCRIRPDKL
jgi:hypothetical protein